MPTIAGEILFEWEDEGFKVQLVSLGAASDVPHTLSGQRPEIGYCLFDGNELIFEGDKFFPSPSAGIDTMATAMELTAGYLTLKPGDTDPDWFDEYTARQLEWCKSARCDELNLIATDWEEANGRG